MIRLLDPSKSLRILLSITLAILLLEPGFAREKPSRGNTETTAQADAEDDLQEMSLEEINRQLENPLSRLWSLVFQENLTLLKGDAVGDTETANIFFQPPRMTSLAKESIKPGQRQ